MLSLQKLKSTVREGLKTLKRDRSLLEGTVYASANRRVVGRIVYTHHFPCQGLQEPKSDDDFGVSVQGYFKRGTEKVVGFGHTANDISLDAVRRALERAKSNAISDPDFHGFPEPLREHPAPRTIVDPKLLDLTPGKEAKLLAEISFKTIEGALGVFNRYHRRTKTLFRDPDFILSGDNFLVTERLALASTKGIHVSDESSIVMSLISAMIERIHSKGRGWGASSTLKTFDPRRAGTDAAERAVAGVVARSGKAGRHPGPKGLGSGGTIPTGNYSVILGPQATTEIFANLLLPSFSAGTLDFRFSVFGGKFGVEIASPLLTMYDDGTLRGGAASKTFTDDGYRTRRIPLIENGRFVGFLQNDYYRKKLLAQKDSDLEEKVGRGVRNYLENSVARSGFRFGGGGGRLASHEPGISATNLFISSSRPISRAELFRKIRNGVYIGALWYTHPIAGYQAGEISGTAVADTFRIKNGKLAEPLRVNSIRIRANLRDIVKNVIGITKNPQPTILWASDEITYAPEVGISNVHCEAIRHGEA